MRIGGFVLGVTLLASLRSCVFTINGKEAWFRSEGRSSLVRRAGFDLSYPAAKLELSVIGTDVLPYRTMGVKGCDTQATYFWGAGQGWVLNTAQKPSKP